jgi:hypothetical protein
MHQDGFAIGIHKKTGAQRGICTEEGAFCCADHDLLRSAIEAAAPPKQKRKVGNSISGTER